MKVAAVGIDLAKNVFHIHGVTQSGKVAVSKFFKRDDMLSYCAQLSACLIGLESCGRVN